MSMSEALELRKKKMSEAPGSGAESSQEEEEDSDEDGEEKEKGPVNKGHGELPPLTSSTNPAFPNAIMKKPSNTHARHAVPKGDEAEKDKEKENETPKEKPKPTSPKVLLSGKNAPSTPTGLTTRSRRSLAAESESEQKDDEAEDEGDEEGDEGEGDEKMAVDE